MDLVSALLDLVKGLFALGLFAYGLTLYRVFRGGIMQGSFRFLVIAPLLFAVTEFLNMLRNVGVVIPSERLIADSFELLFIAALFFGFYRLAVVWKVKR